MRRTVLATLTALAAIGMLPNASAQSNTFTVDCNRGQKIAVALEQGDFRKPLVINLRGTCREFVNITRANVTLRGNPTAEIVAPDNQHDLLAVSADLVTLQDLTLTGGLTGLSQNHAPSFYADKVVVQDASQNGVRVRVGDARLNNCTVQRSGNIGINVVRGGTAILGNCEVLDSGQAGVSVTQNSFVNINGSTIMGSGAQGVLLTQGSGGSISSGTTIAENDGNGIDVSQSQLLVSGGSDDKANTIRDNGGFGIVGHSSSIGIDMNTITGNGNDGVMGYIGTTLVMHGNTISGNNGSGVRSMGNSLVQIGGATIENNGSSGITLVWGAKLILEEPATKVSGSYYALFCADKESSYAAMAPLDTTGHVDCTDFDN
jgi:hypothetical protein